MADAKSGKTPANDHYFGKRTVEDVHRHIGGPGVGGVALVIAGIGGSRSLNQEHAATRLAPFGGHADATPGARITYYGVVVVPEDVRRRLRAVPDHAGKVDGAAPINEQLRTAHDLRVWFTMPPTRITLIPVCTLNLLRQTLRE
jgi:hypothetical protein